MKKLTDDKELREKVVDSLTRYVLISNRIADKYKADPVTHQSELGILMTEYTDSVLALLQPKIEEFRLQIEALDKKLDDREVDLMEAKREERERILEWRYEPCPHNEAYEKRECDICWHALKGGE